MMPRNRAGGNGYEPPDDRRRIRGETRTSQRLHRIDEGTRATFAYRGRLPAIRRAAAAGRSEPRAARRGVARSGGARRACQIAAHDAESSHLWALARQPQGDALHRGLKKLRLSMRSVEPGEGLGAGT